MLKNGSFINEVSRAGHVNACAFALRRKTVSLFSVIIAMMLASVVLGGCSKPAEQDSGPVYAGETVYKEGAAYARRSAVSFLSASGSSTRRCRVLCQRGSLLRVL